MKAHANLAVLLALLAFAPAFAAASSLEPPPRGEGASPNFPTILAADPLLRRERGIMLYDNAPFTGYVTECHPDSRLKSRVFWRDGKRNGVSESWYTNGQLRERRSYVDNRKHGEHQGWYADGTRRFVLNFNSGVYHGVCLEWYGNGQQYLRCNYQNGQEVGLQQAWESDGRIKSNYVVRGGHRYGLVGAKLCISAR